MRLFDKLFSNRPSETRDVISMMLTAADAAMVNGNYAGAANTYKDILKREPNITALYNLGSLYAQGKGVEQNYAQAARLFHQAELSGDEQAGKLCTKCILDFVHQGLEMKTAEQVYDDLTKFIRYARPEVSDADTEVKRDLYAIAWNHLKKEEYAVAAKLLRANAEFGNPRKFRAGPAAGTCGDCRNAGM